ncbi:L,D-transpeptidase [Metallumcola ferriviriculae]|uniref:L,D-transpeptidase n=1 Tax=Metallumcola ferriviriculae TaxID=3039180 RepID=A0AAU0UTH4_9FIRM|nr:L,D-transpeptidase [Desulfitibacteraceae bacterium MK1]
MRIYLFKVPSILRIISFLLATSLLLFILSLYPGRFSHVVAPDCNITSPSGDKTIISALAEIEMPKPLKEPMLIISMLQNTLTLSDGNIAIKTFKANFETQLRQGEYYIKEKTITLPIINRNLGSRILFVRRRDRTTAKALVAKPSNFLIHGESTLGKKVSRDSKGIILRNRDIEEIYDYIPVGTKVMVTSN